MFEKKIMRFQFVRHAAAVLMIENKKILLDPMLSEAGSFSAIPFTANKMRNPIISLPIAADELVRKTDAVLVTHSHFDHFDDQAARLIPKDRLIFCQPGDDFMIKKKGFSEVKVIENDFKWESIVFKRYAANHAFGFLLNGIMGKSSSYFIRTSQSIVFITGDAVFNDRLRSALLDAKPDIIIANMGSARMILGKPITLTAEDLKNIRKLIPSAKIIAVHMDAINHCGLTKNALKEYLKAESLTNNIFIPDEGDVISLN
jgi:L-ascorbate metabolism protein UlaG (beta-lactamase superfamily)